MTLLFASDGIQSIGYGNTQEEALKNAFSSAVNQYVGVLVDAKTVTKKGRLIEDKILTFSNGYIENYKTLSSKEQMGLWEVKIYATIKKQKVLAKIKKLEVRAKEIKNSEQIYAKLISQIKSKFDAEDLMIKYVQDAHQRDVFKSFYKLNIDSVELDTVHATRKYVPVTIKWSIDYDLEQYDKKSKEFGLFLQKLGAKNVGTYNLSSRVFSKGFYFKREAYNKRNSITIFDRKKFQTNTYQFPESFSVIYPFVSFDEREYIREDGNEYSFLSKRFHYAYQILEDGRRPKNLRLHVTPYDISIKVMDSKSKILKKFFPTRISFYGNMFNYATLSIIPNYALFERKDFYKSKLSSSSIIYNRGKFTFKLPIKKVKDLKQVTINWAK